MTTSTREPAFLRKRTDAGIAWCADRGLRVGTRVSSCRDAWRWGEIVAVITPLRIVVRWDAGTRETVPWTAVA